MLLNKNRGAPYVLFYYRYLHLKRQILSFSNEISRHLSKPDRKFSADIIFAILASKSCLLTDIVDQLHEQTKKVKSERYT